MAGPGTRVDVLLVEDSPEDAEFSLRALRKANVAVNVAHVDDGVAALEFLFRTGAYAGAGGGALPRFVLLDLKLPRIDGLGVLRRIRTDPRTRSLPVVVLTSSREPRDVQEAYTGGANSYVVKPVEYADFVAQLGEVVRYWLQLNEVASA
jgi:CheY-like chemotaxis protein